jgi:hypothetical protein
MAIVLECTTNEQRFVVLFFVGKRTQYEEYSKKMFPIYGGRCSSGKAVHNWAEIFSDGRSKVADDARPGAEVALT